MSVNRRQAFHH